MARRILYVDADGYELQVKPVGQSVRIEVEQHDGEGPVLFDLELADVDQFVADVLAAKEGLA